MEAKERVEMRESKECGPKGLKFEEQVLLINRELADQLRLNREMLTNEEIDVADYTRHCEEFIDPDVVNEYKGQKNRNK